MAQPLSLASRLKQILFILNKARDRSSSIASQWFGIPHISHLLPHRDVGLQLVKTHTLAEESKPGPCLLPVMQSKDPTPELRNASSLLQCLLLPGSSLLSRCFSAKGCVSRGLY